MKNLTIEKIKTIISQLEGHDLVQINNMFCDVVNYPDNYYYDFDDDFFETFFNGRPMEVARAIYFGDIKNWNDSFIYFNGYGNLASTNHPAYIECMDVISETIYENPTDFEGLNDELDSILETINY